MDSQLIILFILLILSGFFSGAEIALVSLSDAKIRSLMKQGGATIKIIEKLKSHPQKLLITILIGNNIANIGASVLATNYATQKFGSEVLGIVTGILTLLVLIFGEIFPKTFAERYSVQCAFVVARPLQILQTVLFPIVWVLEHLMHSLLKLTGGSEEKMTEDEIKAVVSLGVEEGAIESEESQLISNIFNFTDTRVGQVMTPQNKIAALDKNTTIADAVTFILDEGYSRIPVFNKHIDNVIGVLTIQELLRAKRNREDDTKIEELDLNSPILIPESKYLQDLFKEFQWKRQHLALVLNEHGSVTGLVTMEDLLEEIVGEIVDESDEEEKQIEKLSGNSWRVDAEVEVDDLQEALETVFDCDEHKSLSFLLLDAFQKIPRRGEDIEINGFHFFIEKMTGNKIDSVRIIKLFE